MTPMKKQRAPAMDPDEIVRIATGTINANARMQEHFAKKREHQIAGPTESSKRAHPTFIDPSVNGLGDQHQSAIKRHGRHQRSGVGKAHAKIAAGNPHGAGQFAHAAAMLGGTLAAEAKPARDAARRRKAT